MVLTLLVDMRWRVDRVQRPQASAGSSADAEMNSLISGGGGGGGGEKTGALTPSSYRWSGSAEGWLVIHKQC